MVVGHCEFNFVVSPDSALNFYHYYSLEPAWDFSYVEIDDGSGWWHTLDEYNGNQLTWTQVSYALSGYNGQTVRVRFRFVSDYSTYAEGWYIDDVLVPMLGIQELNTPQDLSTISLNIHPNPFRDRAQIRYEIRDTGYEIQDISLRIYDATGRLVKSLNPESRIENQESAISWNGDDNAGRKLPGGVYFVTLETPDRELVEKAILVR